MSGEITSVMLNLHLQCLHVTDSVLGVFDCSHWYTGNIRSVLVYVITFLPDDNVLGHLNNSFFLNFASIVLPGQLPSHVCCYSS